MKIIQIGMGWFPEQAGGLNRFYYDCCDHLPQIGVEITGLVTGSSQVAIESQGKIIAFAPINSSIWHRWGQMRQFFAQITATDNYQLITTHFPLYTFPILNQIGQKPLVVHFHGPWYLEGQIESDLSLKVAFKWCLEKLVYLQGTHFIVLSQAFQKILSNSYQINPAQITVIPGGVNQENFALEDSLLEARKKLGWSQNRPIILAVRRLAQRMGLDNLIKAMAEVKLHHQDALLLIAGKGPLYQSLQSLIDTYDLVDYVQLLGFISDAELKLAYRAANFSIIPTIALEGFGLIAIESLAMGTPALGTPVGGIPEILNPLSSDLILSGVATEDLAAGIVEALGGKRHLPTATECQNYVTNNYSWSIVAQKISETYQQIISSR